MKKISFIFIGTIIINLLIILFTEPYITTTILEYIQN